MGYERKNTDNLKAIVEPLLQWYRENARALPWRENRDPYRIWVSEIMLQQTRVEAVKPYFERFLKKFPDLKTLAEADEEVLLKHWEGLGYYNRARNLQKAAQMIVEQHGGVFPKAYEDMLSLPGIGEYTAGAVSSIAFEQPVPAVDGNVLRVMARLLEDERDIGDPAVKKSMGQALGAIYPEGQCGAFTQSLMELGATICLPKAAPLCMTCPLASLCRANLTQRQMDLPIKGAKKPRKKQDKTVFLLTCKGRLAVRKREETGLLAGLWELPNQEGRLSAKEAEDLLAKWRLRVRSLEKVKKRKHIFTHVEWSLYGFLAECETEGPEFTWADSQELESRIALPTAFKQFLEEWID